MSERVHTDRLRRDVVRDTLVGALVSDGERTGAYVQPWGAGMVQVDGDVDCVVLADAVLASLEGLGSEDVRSVP